MTDLAYSVTASVAKQSITTGLRRFPLTLPSPLKGARENLDCVVAALLAMTDLVYFVAASVAVDNQRLEKIPPHPILSPKGARENHGLGSLPINLTHPRSRGR